MSFKAKKAGLGGSLFERLVQAGNQVFLLDVQYRMHPTIAMFPSDTFYESRIRNGILASDRIAPHGFPWPDPSHPIAFVSVGEVNPGSRSLKMCPPRSRNVSSTFPERVLNVPNMCPQHSQHVSTTFPTFPQRSLKVSSTFSTCVLNVLNMYPQRSQHVSSTHVPPGWGLTGDRSTRPECVLNVP
jgi:hypothetical protein